MQAGSKAFYGSYQTFLYFHLKHKKIDGELSKKIQQGRISKGYTQKQLANRLSIPLNEINEMECGKFIYNGQKISKVKRFLSIK